MGTVPTGELERDLRKLYLQWIAGITVDSKDLSGKIDSFRKRSEALIAKKGGYAASLGSLGDFPAPKLLELSPYAGKVYNDMQQAAIQASILTGLQSKDAARQMFNAGMDKSYKRLERLARTETVSAYWKNQWDSTADLPLLVMVWGSESGPRTCDYCLSREGLVVEDRNIRDHPNGRCTLVPTLRSRVAYKGTLQPDGSVTQDPNWGKPKAAEKKIIKAQEQRVETEADLRARYNEHTTKILDAQKSFKGTDLEWLYSTEYRAMNQARIEIRDALSKIAAKEAAVKRAAAAARKAAKPDPFLTVGQLPKTPRDLHEAVLRGGANPKGASWARFNGGTPSDNLDYGINCTRVSAATEMRARGFDVAAAPAGVTANKTDAWIKANWNDPATGKARALKKAGSEAQLIKDMEKLPDGSRYLVVGAWKGGGAHIWNAEKVNGKVRFVEGQVYNGSGQDMTRKYLNNLEFERYKGTHNAVRWMRVDDLNPTEKILKAFE